MHPRLNAPIEQEAPLSRSHATSRPLCCTTYAAEAQAPPFSKAAPYKCSKLQAYLRAVYWCKAGTLQLRSPFALCGTCRLQEALPLHESV
eukprot:5443070-Amphidinium_carterae.1